MESAVFRLYACCILVRGARRSTICDLQRQTYHLVPNGLYDILTRFHGCSLDEIKRCFDSSEHETIEEYFEFLGRNELGFWCDEPACFPVMDLGWEAPERITNAIIDTGPESSHDYGAILDQLNDLGCRALLMRWFCFASFDRLDSILTLAWAGRLRSIDLIMPYGEEWSDSGIEKLCRAHRRITSIWLHSAPQVRSASVLSGTVPLMWRTQVVTSEMHCGEVRPEYFVININSFAESQKLNSCLNRKIGVDRYGEVRNCPAMGQSFGNVKDTSLQSVVLRKDFTNIWEINKDQIEICKDCEFRYICTDCRALIRDQSDRYSKPSKCTYDPYSAEWR
jgi:SPASM domain peptide maturase of grasp-with-spasm system